MKKVRRKGESTLCIETPVRPPRMRKIGRCLSGRWKSKSSRSLPPWLGIKAGQGFVKLDGDTSTIDLAKVKPEAVLDNMQVLKTNTALLLEGLLKLEHTEKLETFRQHPFPLAFSPFELPIRNASGRRMHCRPRPTGIPTLLFRAFATWLLVRNSAPEPHHSAGHSR